MNLPSLSDTELLQFYGQLMDELLERGLIRSSNNPVSDYAEKIVCERFHLSLQKESNKGYDAVDEKTGVRYQIKARRVTRRNKSRQLGVIRNLDEKLFDYLIAVFFNGSFKVEEIWQMPRETIKKYSRFSDHQNGHIIVLGDEVLKSEGVTRLL